mgnify:CR=1 FL=1
MFEKLKFNLNKVFLKFLNMKTPFEITNYQLKIEQHNSQMRLLKYQYNCIQMFLVNYLRVFRFLLTKQIF